MKNSNTPSMKPSGQSLVHVEQIPSEAEFDLCPNRPRSELAWREFGGLTIQQAYNHFIQDPSGNYEHFVWMGSRAFAFYYPVLEQYLRTYRVAFGPGDLSDSYASGISMVFICQFLKPATPEIDTILPRVVELSHYIRSRLSDLASAPYEQQCIDSHWQILQTQIIR